MKINVIEEKKENWKHDGGLGILNNRSASSLFNNLNLAEKTSRSKNTLELATNTGTKRNNREADAPGFRTVWCNDDATVNIFGFADLAKKH